MPIAFFATGAEYSTLVQPWLLQLLRYGAGRLETLGRRNAFVRFIDIAVLFVYLVLDFRYTFFFSRLRLLYFLLLVRRKTYWKMSNTSIFRAPT